MATKQHIRKVAAASTADFDEQQWPINVALLILGAFVAGIVLAASDFDDPRVFYNGWVRMLGVLVTMGLLFAAVVYLQRQVMRRVQLCVLVSLLFHLWLALYLHQHYLRLLAQEELRRARHEEAVDQPMTVPDYHWEQVEQPEMRQSFEEPVQTQDFVDAESEPLEPQLIERPMPTREKPEVEPAEQERQQPSPAELRRAELSAPRRAEAAAGGQVSRQEWKQRPLPDEPIAQPEIRPPGEQPEQPLIDQVASVQRRETRAPRPERQVFSEPSSQRPVEAVELARSARESEAALERPTTPAPTRRLTQPAEVAQAEAAMPQPVPAVEQPQPVELAPATELAARSPVEPARPVVGKQAAEPAPLAPAEPARADPQQRRADSRPELAQSAQQRPARSVRAVEVATEAADQQHAVASIQPAPSTQSALSPAEASISRQSAQATPAPIAELPAAAVESPPGVASHSMPAPSQPSRAGRREPTPEALAAGSVPSRARTPVSRQPTADVAVEPTPTALAATAEGGEQSSPLQPTARTEQRQVAGLPGGKQAEPTAGIAVLPTEQGAPPPVAVAPRPTAGQTGEGTPDLRADAAALLTRAPTGINLPAAAADPTPRAGGVAAAERAASSTLAPGQMATIQRASSVGAPTNRPDAASSAEFSVGAAEVVTVAGKPAPSPTSPPAPAADGRPTPQRRTTGPASLSLADIDAAAEAEPVSPAADTALVQTGEPAYSAAATELARAATSGLPTGTAAKLHSSVPYEAGTELDTAQLTRRGSGDVILASTAGAIADSPQRVIGGPALAEHLADALAATPIAVVVDEPDQPASGALEAAELGPQRHRPGLPGTASDRPPAAELAMEPGPAATTPGTTPGPRRLPDGREEGPVLAAVVGGAPMRQTNAPGLPRGLAEAIEPEPVAAVRGADTGLASELAEGVPAGEPSRQEGGLPVQIAALPGPGGLSFDPSPEVGVPSRRASRESEVVHDVSSRFVVERSGGELAIDGTVLEPTEGFRHRTEGRRAEIAQSRGGSEGTERAVEMGLDFLARIQFPDGRWSLHELPPGVNLPDPALGSMQADTAATGLALLAYLGAGYTHLDDKHRVIVDKGLDWLVRHQKPNGDLFTGGSRPAWFYSHGIAAIALCEAYGMTQAPELREPAQAAIRFICETQHPTRGGWRYDLDSQGRSRESDTSVSGWQLLALKSAQMAGLEVPSEVLTKVDAWLDLAQAPQAGGQYVYNPFAAETPEQQAGRNPNLAMTAEAMLMRIYLGRNRQNARLMAGADFLRRNPPEVGTRQQPLRDCYYWYYATQAMFQMQDPYWTEWNDRLRPLMESGQEQTGPLAGSWHPLRPVPDRWGHAGGRLYVTTLHLLMLEVYYRHLPLFQELSR